MAMKYQNLLLVDDDEDDGEIFIAALKAVSGAVAYTVLTDATEALNQLSSKEIIPDVIFLDLNMPVMNGQQFLFEVKKNQRLQNIPVVIFSTTSHFPTIQLIKESGAHDFITKPNNFDELVYVLKNFLSEPNAE